MHSALSSVYAYASDLDAWMAGRHPSFVKAVDHPSPLSAPIVEPRTSTRVAAAAHECDMRARHFMGKRTASSVVLAIREFRKALDIEPTWAAPHVGIAEAYVVLAGSEFRSPQDGYPKARAAARQALEIDSQQARAHAVLGIVYAFLDADWSSAESELRSALALDPNSASPHYWYGIVLMNLGQFSEAKKSILRAVDRDPLSAPMTANVSRPLIVEGDWDGALEWCQRAMDLDSEFWFVHLFKGWAHDGKGQHDLAREALETSVRLGGSSGVVASLAHACAKQGDRAAAENLIAQLLGTPNLYVSPTRVARVCAALGRTDEAFAWLERACNDGSIRSNTYPHYDYALAALRSDPRFASILRRLNLPS